MKTQRKQTTLRVKLKPYQTKSAAVVFGISGSKNHRASIRCRCGLIKHHQSQTASFSHAVARSIAETQKKGNPIAKYDVQSRRAYLEYPDGKKVYVE